MKVYIKEILPKTKLVPNITLVNAETINPAAIKYLGLLRSERIAITNLLIPYAKGIAERTKPSWVLLIPSCCRYGIAREKLLRKR
ncbi:MAG: hypothetical protein ACD_69C00344G0002 [uncultured bacterium]|nr:MAG: hypothetical protein ACD_69C00344G0002 [uncultured bacterium]